MQLRSESQDRASSPLRIPSLVSPVTGKHERLEPSRQLTSPRSPKRARLTYENLKAHRGSCERPKTIPRKKKASSGDSQTESQSSSTTTGNRFGQQLSANGVVHLRTKAEPPKDVDEIMACLERDRASPSPEQEDWSDYIEAVGESRNEATLQLTAWYKLANPPPGKGYLCDANIEWTEVDGPVTSRIGNAKPDITESYRLLNYPQKAIDGLGANLAPSTHPVAMPTFAVEVKSIEKSLTNAELQCAYDGAIMVDAARSRHEYLGKRPDLFWNTTQALTLAYNGREMNILASHAIDSNNGIQHHSYPLLFDTPWHSFEHFKATRKHTRNAQDWSRDCAAKTLRELREYDHTLTPLTPPQSNLTGYVDETRAATRQRMSEVVEE